MKMIRVLGGLVLAAGICACQPLTHAGVSVCVAVRRFGG